MGLKTYEVKIDEQQVTKYIKWTQSNKDPTISVWTFIMALFLLILNLVGKDIKNSYREEYSVRKIVESYFNMELFEVEGIEAHEGFAEEMLRVD